MKRIIFILISILLMASCSSNPDRKGISTPGNKDIHAYGDGFVVTMENDDHGHGLFCVRNLKGDLIKRIEHPDLEKGFSGFYQSGGKGYCAIGLSPPEKGYLFINPKGDFLTKQAIKKYESLGNGYVKFSFDYDVSNPKNSHWGILDGKGSILMEPKYSEIGSYADGLFLAKSGEKYGYINKNGKEVIPFQYADAKPFSEGTALVYKDEQSSPEFMDTDGHLVLKSPYPYVRSAGFSSGLVGVADATERFGYMDKAGSLVIDLQFQEVSEFTGDLAAVKKDDLWGIIDKTGAFVLAPAIDCHKAWMLSDSVMMAEYNPDGVGLTHTYKLLNTHGEPISEEPYDRISVYTEDHYAIAKSKNDWVYIDLKAGNIINDASYDSATPFDGGYAAVSTNGKYGIINRKGNYVIPPEYNYLGPVVNGVMPYKKAGQMEEIDKKERAVNNGYMDRKGNIIFAIDDLHAISLSPYFSD